MTTDCPTAARPGVSGLTEAESRVLQRARRYKRAQRDLAAIPNEKIRTKTIAQAEAHRRGDGLLEAALLLDDLEEPT